MVYQKEVIVINALTKTIVLSSLLVGGVCLYKMYNPDCMKDIKRNMKKMKKKVNNMYLDMM